LVGLIASVFLLFAPTLRFSFTLDDSYDLVVARYTSYRELLLQPLAGFRYYRPFTFLLYKLVNDVWGGTQPWHYHLLSLTLHMLNGLLVAALVRRIAGPFTAVVSATLFLTFPFAYQAVQIVCSLPHVLVTSSLLGTLLLWEIGIGIPGIRGQCVRCTATLLALGAPGFHETGVLSGAFSLLWIACRGRRTRLQLVTRHIPWLAAQLIGNATYLAIWFWGFDKPGAPSVTSRDRAQNTIFWLQAAAYPFTRELTTFLDADWLARHAWLVVPGSALIGGMFAIAFHSYGRQLQLALGALGFGFLSFLPAMLFLPFHGYLEDGPRLLYPAAPALATFWGLLPRAGWYWRRARWLGAILGLLIIWLTVARSIAFIALRNELGTLASRAQETVVEAARENPGWLVLVVNAPAWLALHRYEFPIGHFGVNAQPEYLGFDGLLDARLGRRQPVQSLVVELPRDRGWYTIGPHGRPASRAELDAFRLSGWVIRDIPQLSLTRVDAG
jgi:hypothetical protein